MKRGIGSTDHDHDHDHDHSSDVTLSTGGGPIIRPIGVSPALEKEQGEDWYRGSKWPPDGVVQFWKNAAPTEFPRAYWSSFHYSFTVLGEFVQASSAAGDKWNSFEPALRAKLPTTQADIDKELKQLVELIEYRSGVMSEALAQRENPWAYYRGIFMSDTWSAPYTRDLLEIALRVGQFVVMHYKREFKRPRPSQYSPALLPPIDVPGHASFPSGHATEAYLISACLEKVMPPAASTPPPPPSMGVPPVPPEDASPLKQLAQRIARNREVLGLHFPSDSAAGKLLAQKSFALLMECPTIKHPAKGLIALAKKEWWP